MLTQLLHACPPPRSHPFCYFPCFYTLKGAVEGRPLSSTFVSGPGGWLVSFAECRVKLACIVTCYPLQ